MSLGPRICNIVCAHAVKRPNFTCVIARYGSIARNERATNIKKSERPRLNLSKKDTSVLPVETSSTESNTIKWSDQFGTLSEQRFTTIEEDKEAGCTRNMLCFTHHLLDI